LSRTDTSRFGIVTVDGDYASLEFERVMSHSPEEVWNAITNPDQLARWFMTDAKIDGRRGGKIEFWSGTSKLHVTGEILIWSPPRVFEYEWNLDPRPEFPTGERSIVRWEIVHEGDHSLVRMTHRHLTRQSSRGFSSGTHVFLDRLEASLDGLPLPDFKSSVEALRQKYFQMNPSLVSDNRPPRR
jgi:uncharacterized protein YndB with AHSA1/START domain